MIVELAARTLDLPPICPCCGDASDGTLDLGHALTVPYCQRCLTHVRAWDGIGAAAFLALVCALTMVCLFVHVLLSVFVALAGGVLIARYLGRRHDVVRAMCSPACVEPGRAVRYLGCDGETHRFDLAPGAFATELMSRNDDRRGTSVSDDDALLVWSRRARPSR